MSLVLIQLMASFVVCVRSRVSLHLEQEVHGQHLA